MAQAFALILCLTVLATIAAWLVTRWQISNEGQIDMAERDGATLVGIAKSLRGLEARWDEPSEEVFRSLESMALLLDGMSIERLPIHRRDRRDLLRAIQITSSLALSRLDETGPGGLTPMTESEASKLNAVSPRLLAIGTHVQAAFSLVNT